MTLPPVVDAAWLAEHIRDDDVLVADVRGPNAHARGHISGSIPMMIGTPGQFSSPQVREEFAAEAALRLRRHGVTGEERLVLYDGGDGTNAAAALQVAELGGHRRVAVLVGGIAGWPGEVETGIVQVEKTRAELTPRPEAVDGWFDVVACLEDAGAVILDVRRDDEFAGRGGYPCDPRQGHIPGARNVEVSTLFAAPGVPRSADDVRELVGVDAGERVIAYCHSGSRSGHALIPLRAAGYTATNYFGSWHEWSRRDELPIER